MVAFDWDGLSWDTACPSGAVEKFKRRNSVLIIPVEEIPSLVC